MAKKNSATTTHNPLGVCEKLFNAFHINPMVRRLTFRQNDVVAADTATSSPPPLPSQPQPPLSLPSPPPLLEPVPPPQLSLPPPPPPPPQKVIVQPQLQPPSPPPPPPPQAVPEPQPARAPKPAPLRPKQGLNERADEYITRTRGKIRSGSGVGRTPSSLK